MASKGSYHRGEMDISEQTATFDFFNTLTKWGSLIIGTLVLFLVLWFCTGVGFVGALVTAIVVDVIGVALLREKPQAAAAH
jgi:hypothetical protein